ncbi:OLC1v1021440C1 [Oldenlandia corymbosa var. corymbosa]|uniref:OLC1v1021440C1 n=1 Tax=Oldenlandia corymbosa var. corymbosa TaxID=529605 RepID=A0AAV1BX51_OLDCO|nr:OLC1v1021440C1 [Oldenlandia corymbosa var. corymbosa]
MTNNVALHPLLLTLTALLIGNLAAKEEDNSSVKSKKYYEPYEVVNQFCKNVLERNQLKKLTKSYTASSQLPPRSTTTSQCTALKSALKNCVSVYEDGIQKLKMIPNGGRSGVRYTLGERRCFAGH